MTWAFAQRATTAKSLASIESCWGVGSIFAGLDLRGLHPRGSESSRQGIPKGIEAFV